MIEQWRWEYNTLRRRRSSPHHTGGPVIAAGPKNGDSPGSLLASGDDWSVSRARSHVSASKITGPIDPRR
jgi:hypothetical protein